MTAARVAIAVAVMSVSAYDDSSGVYPFGVTASGEHTQAGLCACGDSYDFGTVFIIPEVGIYRCEDRGSAITGRHLDLWMPTEGEALEWGRRELSVIVVRPHLLRRGGYKAVIRKYFPFKGNGRGKSNENS